MIYKETEFKGLILISHKIFSDKRGLFKETFRSNELDRLTDYKINFCQENSVYSYKNVLRGLHYQNDPFEQSKLITVAEGAILDVAVDIRKNSKTYGKYFKYLLSAENNESLFIPKGFAHGYLTVSKKALINYKVDNYYKPDYESGVSFKDSHLNIDWGTHISDLIISKKDAKIKDRKW